MSNILQVTDPSTYIDNRNVHTGQEQQSALNSSQIQNPSDPSRVVRADGQKSGTAGDQENESGFSVRNYNGNYTDFLQKLGQENEIKDSLGRILFRDGAFIAKGDEGLGKMVQQLLDSASFEYTEGISADETLFARSLAHSITEDVCREKGVSVEKVAQLKKQVEEGTYEPDPMAIARAMYNL